jgi:hypothetical protein
MAALLQLHSLPRHFGTTCTPSTPGTPSRESLGYPPFNTTINIYVSFKPDPPERLRWVCHCVCGGKRSSLVRPSLRDDAALLEVYTNFADYGLTALDVPVELV